MPKKLSPQYLEMQQRIEATAKGMGLDMFDTFYEMLIAAHEGLDDEASHKLNARLVLLLSNHIGDLRVLREALQAARQGA